MAKVQDRLTRPLGDVLMKMGDQGGEGRELEGGGGIFYTRI
jgi:hypothetical protein